MNKAKQFLIDNSFEFSEAVDNGYGIIMDEDEILEWMQKYAESEVKNLTLPQVSQQREQLIAFANWWDISVPIFEVTDYEEQVDKYLNAINCG